MQKNYYAIIPADVRYDKDLPANAKLLYGEITALSNDKGFCWAGNNYFADLYGKDKSTVARWIQQLVKKGYVTRKIIFKENSREIENRYLQICNGGIRKNAGDPIRKNAIDNNTSFNITKEYIVEIINYLNDRANKKFKTTTSKTSKCIQARFNEGFQVEDFKKVIDNKVSSWKEDAHWNKFLRPETLFGTKFESYLNENPGKGGEINKGDFDLS